MPNMRRVFTIISCLFIAVKSRVCTEADKLSAFRHAAQACKSRVPDASFPPQGMASGTACGLALSMGGARKHAWTARKKADPEQKSAPDGAFHESSHVDIILACLCSSANAAM